VITNTIEGLIKENYFIMTNVDPLEEKISNKMKIKDIIKISNNKYKVILYNSINDVEYKFWQLCKDDISPK